MATAKKVKKTEPVVKPSKTRTKPAKTSEPVLAKPEHIYSEPTIDSAGRPDIIIDWDRLKKHVNQALASNSRKS
jgi:hypothetical protein